MTFPIVTFSVVDVPPSLCQRDTPGVIVTREEHTLPPVEVVGSLTVGVLVTAVSEGGS